MLETILKITLVLFMVGNLLDLGLRLDLKVALRGFRDFRYMGLTTLWGFILCPALGFLLAMLILVFGVYGKGMLGTAGTFAAGSQFVFLFIVTAGSYWLSFGMPERQKSVLSIGVCCRQIGPGLAPLYIAPGVDPLAIVTTGALGTITPIIAMRIAARIYGKRAGKDVMGGVA
jgi:hypothetical protein